MDNEIKSSKEQPNCEVYRKQNSDKIIKVDIEDKDKRFIIVKNSKQNKITASLTPHTHSSEEEAIDEAVRLSKKNPHEEFLIFKCIGSAKVKVEEPPTILSMFKE